MGFCKEYQDLWKAFIIKPDCFFDDPANTFWEALKTAGVLVKTEIFYCPLTNDEINDKLNYHFTFEKELMNDDN